jgi:hypothetical protein
MTQYLSKYLDKINDISQYKINIDEMDYYNDDNYKYDKEFNTETKMNKRIINLIIDMFYNEEGDNRKELRLQINYMIERKMKHPFFIIYDNTETGTFHPLNFVFQYIKRTIKGKNGDKIFNKLKENKCEYVARIKAEPLNQEFECVICSDEIKYNHIINYNCACKDLICMRCFNKLPPPKKCPLCRHTPYKANITVAKDEPMKRKFTIKYNNKNYEIDVNFEEIFRKTLFYFNTETEKINYFNYMIKTDIELLKEFIEDDDDFFRFTITAGIDYTHFHAKTQLNKRPLEILQNHYYDEDDREEFIENVLGLSDCDDRFEFITEYYETYGIERIIDDLGDNFEKKDETYYIILNDVYNNSGDLKKIFVL